MKKQSKARKSLLAACAGIVASVTSVSAAVRNLPTPPPSGYVDRESSVAVALPTNEGRRVRITLVAPFAPTNAVMAAFGRDWNGDGDLAPEETEARVGVDCGVAVFSSESKSRVEVEERNLSTCSACQPERAGCSFHVFDLKQPKTVSSRWNLAKVTTHNMVETNVAVSAEFYKPGLTILVR